MGCWVQRTRCAVPRPLALEGRKMIKIFITCLAGVFLSCGYTQAEPVFEPEKNTTVMLTAEAAVFMSILKEGGNIPGIPADRKGNLQSGMMCDPQTEPTFTLNAPLRGIFNDTPDTFYEYIVTKETENAPWRITSAWENTKGTKTELALPSEEVQNSANIDILRRKKESTAKVEVITRNAE